MKAQAAIARASWISRPAADGVVAPRSAHSDIGSTGTLISLSEVGVAGAARTNGSHHVIAIAAAMVPARSWLARVGNIATSGAKLIAQGLVAIAQPRARPKTQRCPDMAASNATSSNSNTMTSSRCMKATPRVHQIGSKSTPAISDVRRTLATAVPARIATRSARKIMSSPAAASTLAMTARPSAGGR